MAEQALKFETLAIHAGQEPDAAAGSRALPIHQTTSFVFPSAESAADRFALAEAGPIYTRITNPTQGAVEDRIAALEGGAAGLLLASGQSAITLAILNLAGAGDSVALSPSLYGGSFNLFKHTLSRLGITPQWVEDPSDPESWRAASDETTRAFFAETIPNPKHDILDIEAVAAVAHEVGVPLVVDNTVATPYLLRPLEHGADVVVHSATKFLGGHGTSIAGAIVDGGSFDFTAHAEKYPQFTEPDESYNGLVFAQVPAPFATRARTNLLRDIGPAISPFNAFLIGQGLETLPLRMDRHLENARKVAEFLEADDRVQSVTWASLDSSPYKELADRYLPRGAGSVLGFVLPGGIDAGRRFVDALTLHSHVANIGDVRSLVIHPASTTHSQLSEAEHRAAGIEPGFVRLSVGIEHIDDILADLERGLAAAS
ncbi:PLP-dependent transferase [Brachybacterium muris]|uniref:O-acetylhomoserine aminocarboxypropyltransferase/cysteine synthase family protein n=1 Tax=Brachybacterium muris TaxID=219301 RepID=UPI00195A2AD0|nr:PLP-dependent transferase [Brachybacterium muris]MBM7501796.1 O-acetylhomoserine (thiol)-lyase [Brachybacterium muris]MCT1430762.1 PLP-dependent transferase [Brachybacterium muris]MCT1998009.1 PLP-dependent transferase [Brachybacterium muris]MCT2295793.1 PLP-dependent transferase [Brachybacterium muris]